MIRILLLSVPLFFVFPFCQIAAFPYESCLKSCESTQFIGFATAAPGFTIDLQIHAVQKRANKDILGGHRFGGFGSSTLEGLEGDSDAARALTTGVT